MLARVKAAIYQPASARARKSSVMCGLTSASTYEVRYIAAFMMVRSTEKRNTTTNKQSQIIVVCNLLGYTTSESVEAIDRLESP